MIKNRFLDVFFAGTIISLDNIFTAIAFPSLIFQGALAEYLPLGISIFLMSTIVIGVSYALQNTTTFSIAQLHDEPAILYASMAASIVGSLAIKESSNVLFLTVVLTIAMTTLIVGILFYLIGRLKLGTVIRFLPYPVVCGFLASMGWLIFYGALKLMTDVFTHNTDIRVFFQFDALLHWLPCILAALIMFELRKRRYKYVMQLGMLVMILSFYLVIYILKLPIYSPKLASYLFKSSAFSDGASHAWLLKGDIWRHAFADLSFHQVNYQCLIVFICLISLLLNASALEFIVNEFVDLNKEMRIAGKSNMLASFCGGTVGYVSLSATKLALEHDAANKSLGLWVAIPLLILLYFGAGAIYYVPKLVVGTYLFYIAWGFLFEWLGRTYKQLGAMEYSIVLLIFVSSMVFNILVAVLIGTVISIFIFAFRYSAISAVKYSNTGVVYRSSYQRSPELRSILDPHRDQILYVKLQGFIFFGSIYGLYDRIHTVRDKDYIILDFTSVHSIDSSRIVFLRKIKQFAKAQNVMFIFCGLKKRIADEILRTDEYKADAKWMLVLSDRDLALRWCENKLLDKFAPMKRIKAPSLDSQLHALGFLPELAEHMSDIATRRVYAKDEWICQAGDAAESIYIINSGEVSGFIENKLIFTVSAGNILGEVAMYSNKIRSAALKADEPCIIYEINLASIANYEKIDPLFVTHFNQCMTSILAQRLIEQNQRVSFLYSDL